MTPAAVIAATKPEVGTAAPIDPDAISVESPRLSLYARRSAALVDHANAVLSRHLAKMALAVIGGTRNLASVLRGDTALRAQPDTTECNPDYRRQVNLVSAHPLPPVGLVPGLPRHLKE
jgi:hypothetical protein